MPASTVVFSNHFKFQVGKKLVEMDTDVVKVILMKTGFTFNKDTHATITDVTASPTNELANGSGYTTGGQTVAGGTWTEDDTNDEGTRTFTDVTWTAAGGDIGPTPGAIYYDDTTADDTIICYQQFMDSASPQAAEEKTAQNGDSITLDDPQIRFT